jgi:hypothetical protein
METLGTGGQAQLGTQDLKGDSALMPDVAREVHHGHTTGAHLALQLVTAGKRRVKHFD